MTTPKTQSTKCSSFLLGIPFLICLLSAIGIAPALADSASGYIHDTVSEQYTICYGDSIAWHGMTLRESGTNTIVDTIERPAGEADSIKVYIARIVISQTPLLFISGDTTLCEGSSDTLTASLIPGYNSITWHGPMVNNVNNESITITTGGTYTLTIEDSNNCIHTHAFDVTLHAIMRTDTVVAICAGDSYIIGEDTLIENTTHTATFNSSLNCDSMVTLHLLVLPRPDVIIAGLHPFCEGDTLCIAATGAVDYEWSTGETSHILCITEGGDYSLNAIGANGCMTQRTFSINTHDTKTRHIYDTICDGDMRMFFGRELTQHGDFVHYDTTIYGCDSSDILHLHINDRLTGEININASDSLFWDNLWRRHSGTYAKHNVGSNGCDSTTILHLLLVHGAPVPKLVLFDERLITFDHYLPYDDNNSWHGYMAYRWYRNGNLIRSAHSDFYHNADYSPLEGCYYAEIAINEEHTLWMPTDTICVNILGIDEADRTPAIVSPNPMHRGESVSVDGMDCTHIYLTTTGGRTIADTEGNRLRIPASTPAGLYLLRISDRNGKEHIIKVVVL